MFCQCGPHISPSLQLFNLTTHKVFATFLEAQKLLGYVQETTGDTDSIWDVNAGPLGEGPRRPRFGKYIMLLHFVICPSWLTLTTIHCWYIKRGGLLGETTDESEEIQTRSRSYGLRVGWKDVLSPWVTPYTHIFLQYCGKLRAITPPQQERISLNVTECIFICNHQCPFLLFSLCASFYKWLMIELELNFCGASNCRCSPGDVSCLWQVHCCCFCCCCCQVQQTLQDAYCPMWFKLGRYW